MIGLGFYFLRFQSSKYVEYKNNVVFGKQKKNTI